MEREQIIQLVHSHPKFVDFVNNNSSSMVLEIGNVPVVIYKVEIGAAFYYKEPFNPKCNYNCVVDFMKVAIPELSKLIIKERDKKTDL